ncbi:hypothetical protein [Solobacterium moorei]|nr:hypothetical protein [Solobacterium moorei]
MTELTELICGILLWVGFFAGIVVTAIVIMLVIVAMQFIEDKKNDDE